MSEALALASDYFETDDEDMHQTGWLALLMWARDLPAATTPPIRFIARPGVTTTWRHA